MPAGIRPAAARAEHVHAVAVRLADVQLNRLSSRIGEVELAVEYLALDVARREIVVVVQPDFAPQQALWPADQLAEPGLDLGGIAAGIVRVHAGGGVEEIVPGGQIEHGLLVRRLLAGVGDHQRAQHACGAEAVDYGFAIGVERFVRDVAVGVKQHHGSRLRGNSSLSIIA